MSLGGWFRWCSKMFLERTQTKLYKHLVNLKLFSDFGTLIDVDHGERLGQSSPESESGESATWTPALVVALVNTCWDAKTLWKLVPESLLTKISALIMTVTPSMPSGSIGVAIISHSRIRMRTKLGHRVKTGLWVIDYDQIVSLYFHFYIFLYIILSNKPVLTIYSIRLISSKATAKATMDQILLLLGSITGS